MTLWDNMIDFPDISILEDESTVAAFPFLIFEQPCELAFNRGVLFEPLTPIEKLSVVRACSTSYLCMVGDGGLAVISEFNPLKSHEDPVALLFCPPVVPRKPFPPSSGMFVSGPLGQLDVHAVIAPGEGFLRRNRSIVVSPSTDDRIEYLNHLLL